jgi:hypothetical protein
MVCLTEDGQMKPSNKFNHRRKFERTPTPVIAAPVFATTGAVDEDFEDFGEHADYVVAPGLVVNHYGLEALPVIEKVRPAVD